MAADDLRADHGVWKAQDGMAFVYLALLLPVLLFLAGLVADMGFAIYTRQRAQTVADIAAYGGRVALQAGEDVAAAAKAVAAINGFDVVSPGGLLDTSLTVRVFCNVTGRCPDGAIPAPPDNSYASYVTDRNAVEVVIQKTNRTTFARLLNFTTLAVNAWSVATDATQDTYCILGLGQGPNADSATLCSTGTAVCGNGNVDYGVSGTLCGIASNSSAPVSNGGNCKGNTGAADFRGSSASVWGAFYSCGGANAKTSIFKSTFITNPTPPAPIVDPYLGNGQKSWLTGLASLNLTTAAGPTRTLPNYLSSGVGSVPLANTACGVTTSAKVTSGALSGCGTYSIGTFSGGTLDGASGGLFLIGAVTGGTLQNVFYIDSLSGSVTTNNATLVVFSSLNGWSESTISGPTANTSPPAGSDAKVFDGAPKNAGFALASPNGVQFTKAGNDAFRLSGAIYLPGQGSEFHLQGKASISWTCGQLIAGVVELGGNAGMNVDNTCGVTQITGNAHGSRLVQ
jgi:Flp pilus assembly protein TadG